MKIWDVEDLFSEETKDNIINKWKEETKKDFENEGEQENYINENLGNSILNVLYELEDDF